MTLNRSLRLLSLALLFSLLSSSLVLAKKRRRRSKKRRQAASSAPQVPHSDAIAEDLEGFRWGMNRKEVFKELVTRLKARYAKPLSETHDAIAEDELRYEMKLKIDKIKRSYAKFEGGTSGWDVSFIRGEFTHNNKEALLVSEDDKVKHFFFFIQDRLWKVYRVFDSSKFNASSFAGFTDVLQRRYGKSQTQSVPAFDGKGNEHIVAWQDASTALKAVDRSEFYGVYCLVFEDKATLANLDALRPVKAKQKASGHGMVDAVVLDPDSEEYEKTLNTNQDIVDRMTGKIRRRDNGGSKK